MKLHDRIQRKQAQAGRDQQPASAKPSPGPRTIDPLGNVKQRAQSALFAKLGARLYDPSLGEDKLLALVTHELGEILDDEDAPLSEAERRKMVTQIRDDILGYGPVQMFLDDPSVTEIMVNGDDPIYIERDGKIIQTEARFMSHAHLRRVIERIVSQVGRRIDESSPMVDARLPDGSRVNAIVPPLAVDGPVLTVRVFARDPFSTEDLIELGTLTPELVGLLEAAVKGRLNVLISGGTGTGKTTLLNVVSSFLPEEQRIVTIEDAVELQLRQQHVIRLEKRLPNAEGRGEVTIRDLVRNALRMRPDRIVVGEVRGAEALDMLQAMNTGHEGSLSTIHANSPRDALARLETMVLMAGLELPTRAIREQVASALDLVVHLARLSDGSRRVTRVAEVVGMEGDIVTLQDLFVFDYHAGIDERGRFQGLAQPTGIRPQFAAKLKAVGIELPPDMFGTPDLTVVGSRRGS